jgi:hypothetical protein
VAEDAVLVERGPAAGCDVRRDPRALGDPIVQRPQQRCLVMRECLRERVAEALDDMKRGEVGIARALADEVVTAVRLEDALEIAHEAAEPLVAERLRARSRGILLLLVHLCDGDRMVRVVYLGDEIRDGQRDRRGGEAPCFVLGCEAMTLAEEPRDRRRLRDDQLSSAQHGWRECERRELALEHGCDACFATLGARDVHVVFPRILEHESHELAASWDLGPVEKLVCRHRIDQKQTTFRVLQAAGMHPVLQRLRPFAVPCAVLLAAFVLFVAVSYPGYMTYDSFDQLLQARKGPLTDWHPPFMAFQWRILDWIWAGPQLMLMLQGALFLSGTFAILLRFMQPMRAAIAAACVLHFPPVIAPMVVIWKDCQMAGYLVAGAAALMSRDRRWKIAGCVLLVFATAVRYNAAAATAALVIALTTWREGQPRWQRLGLAAATWLAITIAAFGIDALLVEKHLYPLPNSLAFHDLAGSVHYSDMTEAEVTELLADVPLATRDGVRARIDALYHATDYLNLVNGDAPVFVTPATDGERAAVTRAWKTVITRAPAAYLHHRWRVFRQLVELGTADGDHVYTAFHGAPWFDGLVEGHRLTWLQRRWGKAMRAVDHGVSFVYRGWFYLLLAFALLPLATSLPLALALLLSGLAYELAMFFIAPATDPRYSHWLIVCTILAAILLFSSRWKSASRDRHAQA